MCPEREGSLRGLLAKGAVALALTELVLPSRGADAQDFRADRSSQTAPRTQPKDPKKNPGTRRQVEKEQREYVSPEMQRPLTATAEQFNAILKKAYPGYSGTAGVPNEGVLSGWGENGKSFENACAQVFFACKNEGGGYFVQVEIAVSGKAASGVPSEDSHHFAVVTLAGEQDEKKKYIFDPIQDNALIPFSREIPTGPYAAARILVNPMAAFKDAGTITPPDMWIFTPSAQKELEHRPQEVKKPSSSNRRIIGPYEMTDKELKMKAEFMERLNQWRAARKSDPRFKMALPPVEEDPRYVKAAMIHSVQLSQPNQPLLHKLSNVKFPTVAHRAHEAGIKFPPTENIARIPDAAVSRGQTKIDVLLKMWDESFAHAQNMARHSRGKTLKAGLGIDGDNFTLVVE